MRNDSILNIMDFSFQADIIIKVSDYCGNSRSMKMRFHLNQKH